MARGNARMPIYLDDRDHRRFLELLGQVVHRYALQCWAYCLMPNHYHLVLQTHDDNLSIAMRQLNGVYAQWWNRRHERVGHVTQGRFKAQVVQEERYLMAVCRYALLNPVRAGLSSKAEGWPWSSAAATLGLARPPSLLSTNLLLDACGGPDLTTTRVRLAALLASKESLDVAKAIREDHRVIGDEDFVESFRAQAATAPTDVPGRDRRLLVRPSLDALLMDPAGGTLRARVTRAVATGYTIRAVADALGVGRGAAARLAGVTSTGRGQRPAGRPGTSRVHNET